MTVASIGRNGEEEQGFALVEMLTVLAILALIAGLSFPLIAGRRDQTPDVAAAHLMSGFQLARARAISGAGPQQIVFDLGRREVLLPTADAYQLGGQIDVELLTGRELMKAEDRAVVEFYPDGGSSGLVVELKGKPRDVRLTVSWLTGIAAYSRVGDGTR